MSELSIQPAFGRYKQSRSIYLLDGYFNSSRNANYAKRNVIYPK
jgi:hypothetical protein